MPLSVSLSLCLCPCLCLFSLLLLAPVDIKVIKDLPWPPPVGQLDSSPSLPDGDRDISGPASPLPEPSLEDSSGGSCGSFWPGSQVPSPLRPCGLGLEEQKWGRVWRTWEESPSSWRKRKGTKYTSLLPPKGVRKGSPTKIHCFKFTSLHTTLMQMTIGVGMMIAQVSDSCE